MPMYATAKAGIVNFMRSAAKFYKARDVTVNCSMRFVFVLCICEVNG